MNEKVVGYYFHCITTSMKEILTIYYYTSLIKMSLLDHELMSPHACGIIILTKEKRRKTPVNAYIKKQDLLYSC